MAVETNETSGARGTGARNGRVLINEQDGSIKVFNDANNLMLELGTISNPGSGEPKYGIKLYTDSSVFLGDAGTIKVGGKLVISKDRILLDDDSSVSRLLLGKDDAGVVRAKLSQAGYDVLSATDDHLIWSADFNSFKIVDVLTITHQITAGEVAAAGTTITKNHDLGYRPLIIGTYSNDVDNVVKMLPYMYLKTGTEEGGGYGLIEAAIDIESITDTQVTIKLVIMGLLGLSYFAANKNLSFKLYCLRETTV